MDEEAVAAIRAAIRSVLAGERTAGYGGRYSGYYEDTIDACTRAVIAALSTPTQS